MNGHLNVVEYLLTNSKTRKMRLAAKNVSLQTPLLVAASQGHYNIVEYLLNNGANINDVDNANSNIFHWAAYGGNIDMLDLLLSKKLNINGENKYLQSPLWFACRSNKLLAAQWLVAKGVKTNVVDDNKCTALHFAALYGSIEIIKWLLIKELEIRDLRDKGNGRTAICYAVKSKSQKAIELLLEAGSSPTGIDNDGNNILHLAILENNINLVPWILQKYPHLLNTTNIRNRTPLQIAGATNINPEILRLLLESKVATK